MHSQAILGGVYGPDNVYRWFQRWRIFFMACGELWGYEKGEELTQHSADRDICNYVPISIT